MLMDRSRLTVSLAVLGLLTISLGCTVQTRPGSPTTTRAEINTQVQATNTAKPTPTHTPSGPCELVTNSDATIFTRPDPTSDVFSTVPAGFTTTVAGQTASGWFGFDPGVAQAANIGPFRLRWIQPDQFKLSGNCDSVPVVWAPPAGVCFNMPMADVAVHADPDSAAPTLEVLTVGQFAAVVGGNGSGWVKVDLAQGNTGSTTQGWIEQSTLNMNGPCQDLPTLSE